MRLLTGTFGCAAVPLLQDVNRYRAGEDADLGRHCEKTRAGGRCEIIAV